MILRYDRIAWELPPPSDRLWLAAAVLGLSGFAALVHEITRTRILALVLGPTISAFAATLAAVISGVAIGSALGTSVIARTRHPATWLAMTLALVRHLLIYDRDVKAGRWHYLSAGKIRRASLMTVGILGFGRIGKRYAALARECFARVIACDPYLSDADFPSYVQRIGLAELFEQADAISLHVPLNAETRGMVDASLLARLKPGSVVINTARGGVVDIDALRAALDDGRLDGAALDVLPTEPIAPQDPLAMHPRVLLTPHAAFYSGESEVELRRKAALNIVQWAATGRPMYPVVQGSKSPR